MNSKKQRETNSSDYIIMTVKNLAVLTQKWEESDDTQ